MKRTDVIIVTGDGKISLAIARSIGYGKKIIIGDIKYENAEKISRILNNAGFDAEPFEMNISSRYSILSLINKALDYGNIKMLVNGAGVSPSQASIESILKVDLYGRSEEHTSELQSPDHLVCR